MTEDTAPIKIARLEIKQEEHMKQFEKHCAEESSNFDALFAQTRKLEASLVSIDKTLSNQRSFIGAIVLYTVSLFSVIVAAVQYFGKTP
jgi:hypothetical protein